MRTIDADALMNELIRLGYAYSNEEQRAVVADSSNAWRKRPLLRLWKRHGAGIASIAKILCLVGGIAK